MSEEIEKLKRDVAALKERNQRVEADKAWETSMFRTVTIALITYVIAAIVLYVIENNAPLRNALIPAIGYLLSVQSVPFLKAAWTKRYLTNRR